MQIKYPRTKPLLILAFILSAIFWLALTAFMMWSYDAYGRAWFQDRKLDSAQWIGAATLITVALALIGNYLKRASQAARLRSQGVEITSKQYSDLNGRIKSVCKRLELEETPTVFLYRFNRFDQSLSVRYQDRDYLSLDAEIIGALTERQTAIDFLIGWELARLYDPARRWRYFLWPSLVLPLVGTAVQRACIYNYDFTGIAGCRTKVDSALALAVKVSGTRRWKSLSIPHFAAQSDHTRPLLMSLLELLSAKPWVPKRMAQLRALATDSDSFIPRRNPVAYLLALFVPYLNFKSFVILIQLPVFIAWISLSAFWGIKANQHLEENKLWPYQVTKSVSSNKTQKSRNRNVAGKPAKKPTKTKSVTERDPYHRLYQDLRNLGALAKAQRSKTGGIQCEVENVDKVRLHYSASRYAYSCDEPIVYTRVRQGEFEGGRSAHIIGFDWKSGKILRRQHNSGRIK